jgi:biopolymer transport protein TolR
MAFAGGKKGAVKNDINVTPLVDVVLVLLIIFMVITPMLQRGKDVKLPPSRHVDDEQKGDPLVLSMTKDKKVYVESNQVSDDELTTQVAAAMQAAPGRKLLLKGDEALTVGDVRRIFPHIQQAGAHGVALGVEELKK